MWFIVVGIYIEYTLLLRFDLKLAIAIAFMLRLF